MAIGRWDKSHTVMGILYYDQIEILGINFTPSTNQSAVKSWTTVTNSIKAQASDVYYRKLRLNKRIQYVHTYLLARAWFTAQLLPIPKDCER
jgi:hypothetical protein